MITSRDRMLAALVFVPGVVFAIANATAGEGDAEPVASAIAAVGLSGAVAAGVVVKPSRPAYLVAFGWSAFSVVFEILQMKNHLDSGAHGRATISAVLAATRFAGAVVAFRAR